MTRNRSATFVTQSGAAARAWAHRNAFCYANRPVCTSVPRDFPMGPEESPKAESAKEPNGSATKGAAGDDRLASSHPGEEESSERRNGRLTGSSFPADPRSEGPLHWRAAGMLLTLRPHQWIKNVFVLAPVVFAKTIFQVELLTRAAGAFGVFCLLAGAVYTINDLADVEADRQHPIKRHRPIASGRVPTGAARVMAVALILSALATAAVGFGLAFFAVAAGYFCINLAYSFRLKHVAYLDVSCIAAGFVLRVMAGGYGTEVYVSRYLLLCTALLAAFLGFGKRRHELAGAVNAKRQRAALESYTRTGLDRALWITALLTVGTYVAYTLDPQTRAYFQSDWLWPSTIFVVLGVLRFVTLVRSRPRAESPTQEMIKDGPFVGIVLLWVILVFWVVYHLRPG